MDLQTSLIEVTINGELRRLPSGHSVAQVLEDLEIVPDRVAVEMNGTIVRKRDWSAAIVARDARLEIVEFVGGG